MNLKIPKLFWSNQKKKTIGQIRDCIDSLLKQWNENLHTVSKYLIVHRGFDLSFISADCRILIYDANFNIFSALKNHQRMSHGIHQY